jgi:hypothetical protein
MKKVMAALAAGAVLMAGAAFADTMSASFGNTMTTTGADGVTVRWMFNADNTYTMALPDGTSLAGTWARNGAELCVTPNGGGDVVCAPVVEGKAVGDTWTVQTAAGPVTVALTAGR